MLLLPCDLYQSAAGAPLSEPAVKALQAGGALGMPEPATLDIVAVAATPHASAPRKVVARVALQNKRELDRKGFYSGPDELRGVPGMFFRRRQGDNELILGTDFGGINANHCTHTFLALLDGLAFLNSPDELLMQDLSDAAVDRVGAPVAGAA